MLQLHKYQTTKHKKLFSNIYWQHSKRAISKFDNMKKQSNKFLVKNDDNKEDGK